MIREPHPEKDVMLIITSGTQRATGRVNTALRMAQLLDEMDDD